MALYIFIFDAQKNELFARHGSGLQGIGVMPLEKSVSF